MNPDQYQSTNKLAENPYPERSHLLLEGILDIAPSQYGALGGSSGFYIASQGVDLTKLIKLGNRIKGFSPKELEAKVWHNTFTSSGGDLNDRFRSLPFMIFSGYNPLALTDHAHFYMNNVYVTSEDESATYLQIIHVANAIPGRVQSFSYKIYNTIYEFTDTL